MPSLIALILLFLSTLLLKSWYLVTSLFTTRSGWPILVIFTFLVLQHILFSSPYSYSDRLIPYPYSDGRYLLELFLCSNPDDCFAKVLPPIGNSNHSIVSVSVSYSSPSATFKPFHRTVQFGKADWDGFRCFLADVPWSSVLSLGPALAADELSHWMNLGMEIYIPSRTYQIRAHSQPWYTPACAAAIAHCNHFVKRSIILQECWIA